MQFSLDPRACTPYRLRALNAPKQCGMLAVTRNFSGGLTITQLRSSLHPLEPIVQHGRNETTNAPLQLRDSWRFAKPMLGRPVLENKLVATFLADSASRVRFVSRMMLKTGAAP